VTTNGETTIPIPPDALTDESRQTLVQYLHDRAEQRREEHRRQESENTDGSD